MPSRGYARDKFHNCTCDKRPHGHGFRLRNFAADMRNITEIIVHCTATPRSRNVSVADIDSWHRQRGFNQIGYHYVVALDGTVHRGRDESIAGAHCLGHNAGSIGVAYVGGIETDGTPADTRTPQQRESLTALLASLLRRYPGSSVRGHRDFASKACPSFDATAEYARLCKGYHAT